MAKQNGSCEHPTACMCQATHVYCLAHNTYVKKITQIAKNSHYWTNLHGLAQELTRTYLYNTPHQPHHSFIFYSISSLLTTPPGVSLMSYVLHYSFQQPLCCYIYVYYMFTCTSNSQIIRAALRLGHSVSFLEVVNKWLI